VGDGAAGGWDECRDRGCRVRAAVARAVAGGDEREARRDRSGLLMIRDFDGWREALDRADRALDDADAIRTGVQILHEVLELVDRRTGRLIDPSAEDLAAALHDLLDATVRTSAASENVNSILRAYLWGRRYFLRPPHRPELAQPARALVQPPHLPVRQTSRPQPLPVGGRHRDGSRWPADPRLASCTGLRRGRVAQPNVLRLA